MCLFSKDQDKDHYIVKIYRRNIDDPKQIVGQVLQVCTECKRPFTNIKELTEILSSGGNLCRRSKKSSGKSTE